MTQEFLRVDLIDLMLTDYTKLVLAGSENSDEPDEIKVKSRGQF